MTLGTRSYDALWRAARIPGVDTLYFLSDGSPLWGQLQNWDAIHKALAVQTWHNPLAFWAVAFDAQKHGDQMRALSYRNFGLYEDL